MTPQTALDLLRIGTSLSWMDTLVITPVGRFGAMDSLDYIMVTGSFQGRYICERGHTADDVLRALERRKGEIIHAMFYLAAEEYEDVLASPESAGDGKERK